MSSDELKDCPFCGSRDLTKLMAFRDGASSVGCRNCGANGPTVVNRGPLTTDCFDTTLAEVAGWNRRSGAIEGRAVEGWAEDTEDGLVWHSDDWCIRSDIDPTDFGARRATLIFTPDSRVPAPTEEP